MTFTGKTKDFTEQEKSIIDFFTDKILKHLDCECWVAGGAIREFLLNREIGKSFDIDIYTKVENIPIIKYYLIYNGGVVVRETKNSTLFNLNGELYDIVTLHTSNDILQTIAQFDFTVCAIGVSKDKITYADPYFDHLSQRSLVLNSHVIKYPDSFIIRLQKYIKKGFSVAPEDQDAFMNAIRATTFKLRDANFKQSQWTVYDSKYSTPKPVVGII